MNVFGQNRFRPSRLILLGYPIVSIFASGCIGTTRNAPWRTFEPAEPLGKDALGSFYNLTNLSPHELRASVGERVTESYDQFVLSAVEFDDQGKLWDKNSQGGDQRQLGALDHLIEDPIAQKNGAIILVFIHGWDENAEVANGTVRCFRSLLDQLNNTEQQTHSSKPRRILGVYVGWRGRSQVLPIVKWFTFWSRKTVAHKIGHGDMDELLAHLSKLKQAIQRNASKSENPTRLVIVGHSFGGAMIYSAIDNILKEETFRALLPVREGYGARAISIGKFGTVDLIVLVNPAFEALLYSGLPESYRTFTNYNPYQTTVLMTIGAENDKATGILFPLGQSVPARIQNFAKGSNERALNSTSLGHYTNYFDCRLSAIRGGQTAMTPATLPSPPLTAQQRNGKAFRLSQWGDKGFRALAPSNDVTRIKGIAATLNSVPNRTWKIEPYHGQPDPAERSPFLVIAATPQVVDNHSGIWGDTLVEFIRDFIIVHDRRQAIVEKSNPELRRSEE